MSTKLAKEIREFYLDLLKEGFTMEQAFTLTTYWVPEKKESPEPYLMTVNPAPGIWGDINNLPHIPEVKKSPVSRPAQAESITEVPPKTKESGKKVSKEEIKYALDTLIEAIGVFGHRMDSPVSLIFGNGFALTETTKDLNTKQYKTGTSQVRDWIYDNQKGE